MGEYVIGIGFLVFAVTWVWCEKVTTKKFWTDKTFVLMEIEEELDSILVEQGGDHWRQHKSKLMETNRNWWREIEDHPHLQFGVSHHYFQTELIRDELKLVRDLLQGVDRNIYEELDKVRDN